MNKRGYTLIELAIASLIFVVVGGIAFYFLKSGYDARKISSYESEVTSDQDRAIKIVSELLDQAIRVDGVTKNANPSITETVNSMNGNFEEITFVANRHPHVMTRVQGLILDGGVYKFQIFQNPPANQGDAEEDARRQTILDLQDTVYKFLPQTDASIPVIFQSAGETNLFSVTPPQAPNMQVPLDLAPFINNTMTFSRWQSTFSNDMRVGMTSRVRIFVDDINNGVGTLKVEERFGANTTVKEVLKGVTGLQFLYAFDTYHRANASEMTVPTGSLNKPDASDADYRSLCDYSLTPQFCLDQSDLSSVRVVLSTKRDVDINKTFAQNERGFSIENGQMRLTKVHFATPKNFGNKQSQWDLVASLDCQNPNNRCKGLSACDDYFNSDNVDSPRWEGYKRHVLTPNPSHYCLCGTTNRPSSVSDINFVLPETQAGYDAVPFYSSQNFQEPWPLSSTDPEFVQRMKLSAANRVLSCSTHFQDYIWAFKNPFQYIAHNGITQSGSFLSQYRVNGGRGNMSYKFPAYKTFKDVYESGTTATMPDGLSWRDHITCKLGFDGISGNFRWAFQNQGQQVDSNGRTTNNYIALGRASQSARIQKMTGGAVRPWEEKCLCQSQVSNINAEWACNHMTPDPRLGGSMSEMGAPGCPETWSGEVVDASSTPISITQSITPPSSGLIDITQHKKVFTVKNGNNNPEGLKNTSLALLCQCLQDRYFDTHIPISEGWAVSNYWDFRTPGSLAVDASPSGPTGIDLQGFTFPAQQTQNLSYNDSYPYSGSPHTWPGWPTGNQIASINSKEQVAFYRDDASGTIKSISGRCDQIAAGAGGATLQRVLNPAVAPSATLDSIRNQFAGVCSSTGGTRSDGRPLPYCNGSSLKADTDYVNKWAVFCNTNNTFNEQLGTNAWYQGAGIQQARKYLTNRADNQTVPTWCGGPSQQGQGGT